MRRVAQGREQGGRALDLDLAALDEQGGESLDLGSNGAGGQRHGARVQVFKDHLWVLADSAIVDGEGTTRRSTDILTFSTAGEFKGGHFNVIHPGPAQDVIGAGMAFKAAAEGESADRLLVVAGCAQDGQASDGLCLQRFLLSTREDWYPSFAGDGSTQTRWNLAERGVASTAAR